MVETSELGIIKKETAKKLNILEHLSRRMFNPKHIDLKQNLKHLNIIFNNRRMFICVLQMEICIAK